MSDEKELTDEEKRAKAREVNQNFNKSRLERMEEIADASEEVREEEDEAERTERLAAEEDARSQAEAKRLQEEGTEETKVEADTDSDTKTVNGEVYYRQIVNGAEKWQTLKEIRANAAKVESADEYLRQASESVRNASRLALSKDVPGRPDKDGLKKLLASAALGDEEAIEQLASVLSATPSEVTPDMLRAVDQRLSFRTELASLESEQKELLEDPYLKKLYKTKIKKKKKKNPNPPLATAYRTIGKDLREHFGSMLKGTTQEKLERKRKLAQVPSAAARQQVDPDETGEEDHSVIIERMAKARGSMSHFHPGNSSTPVSGKTE